MALSIQQSQEYLGNDHWRWSVWLGCTQEELDAIDHVLYILHPTFHNPVRHISDRTTNFRLDTSGWGAFTIHAKVGIGTVRKHNSITIWFCSTPAVTPRSPEM